MILFTLENYINADIIIKNETRKVGKSRTFKANMKNPIVKGLSAMQLKTADYFITKELKDEKVDIAAWL